MQLKPSKTILNYINYEDYNENLQFLADFIGEEKVKEMISLCGGMIISIPTSSHFSTLALSRKLKEEKPKKYSISEIIQIADEFKLTVTTVKDMIKKI